MVRSEIISKLSKRVHHNIPRKDLEKIFQITLDTIIQGIKNYSDNCDEIYICGGGAFNKTILKYIQMEAEKVFNKISLKAFSQKKRVYFVIKIYLLFYKYRGC